MAKVVLCNVAKLSKIKQMWHLQMICSKFAIEVNPFFRPVLRQDKGKIPTKCMSGTPFLLLSKSPLPYAHSMYGHVGRWAEVSWCHSEISLNRWLSNFYRNGGSAPGEKLTNRIVTLGFPFLYGLSPFVIIHYSPQNSLLSSPNVVFVYL